MSNTFKAVVLSSGLAVAMFASVPYARAVDVSFSIGDVAVGYQDGYWDHSHHWHAWRNNDDWQNYRHTHPEAYHEWRHDDPHHHD